MSASNWRDEGVQFYGAFAATLIMALLDIEPKLIHAAWLFVMAMLCWIVAARKRMASA
jgi:hypothetical protein